MGPKRKIPKSNIGAEFSDAEDIMEARNQNERPIDGGDNDDKWEPAFRDDPLDDINYEVNYEMKNQQEDPCFTRKQELLQDCLKLLQSEEILWRTPLNIAVIGPPGCGKSSFLNTVFASLDDDCWFEYAKCGEFGNHDGVMGTQVSTRLKSYLKEQYYRKRDFLLLPTFIDMTGFENDSSPINEELLQLVFKGKVEEKEVLNDILTYGRNNGITAMRQKYRSRFSHRRINRIIMLCSANPDSALPSQLLRTVVKVANNLDITYYGVLTHVDKFKAKTNKAVADREEKFLKTLGLPRNRFARVINYCPEVDPNRTYEDSIIPTINAPVLRLIRQILTPEPNDSIRYPEEYVKCLWPFIKNIILMAILVAFITDLVSRLNSWKKT